MSTMASGSSAQGGAGPTPRPMAMDHSSMGHDMSKMAPEPPKTSSPAPTNHAAKTHDMAGMQMGGAARPASPSSSGTMDHSATMGHDKSQMNAGSAASKSAPAMEMPMKGDAAAPASASPRTSREIAALSPSGTLKGDPQDAPQSASVDESRKAAEAGSTMNMGQGGMDMGSGKKSEEPAPMKMDHGKMKMDGPPSAGPSTRPTPTPAPPKPPGSPR